ncbi:hypothetical protein BT69DRAFT_1334136 [Atractiella rhizophila]|nr:hypothetical protein BT69DRAFT_1334136 [Atractiella rhizophila]
MPRKKQTLPSPRSITQADIDEFEAWNAEQEQHLSQLDGNAIDRTAFAGHHLDNDIVSSEPATKLRLSKAQYEEIYVLLKDITEYALHQEANGEPFPLAWREAGYEDRRRHLLTGLMGGFRNEGLPTHHLEKIRVYVFELQIEKLLERTGEGFLELFGSCVIDLQAQKPDKPLRFNHPSFMKAMSEITKEKGGPEYYEICNYQRNLAIVLTVWHTMLSFYGRFEPQIAIKSSLKSSKITSQGDLGGDRMRQLAEECAAERKMGTYRCDWEGCGKGEFDLPGDQKLKLCQGCKQARYCSKACQTLHWPEHKAFCRSVTSPVSPSSSKTVTSSEFLEQEIANQTKRLSIQSPSRIQ